MDEQTKKDLQAGYDRVAEEYARRIYDELQHKPLDGQLLDRFADAVRDRGLVSDVGCGPGHVARYLHERGVAVCGVDLSAGMIEKARQLNPGIPFEQGDMLALEVEDASWAGVIAFYSILHVPRPEVVAALRELKRALKPGGLLLIAFHIGDEVVHRDEVWDQPVSIDFVMFQPEAMARYLRAAGFEIEEVIVRDPYPDVEHQSHRAYIFARKPTSPIAEC